MTSFSLEMVRKELDNIHDVSYKEYKCGNQSFAIVFIESIANTEIMSNFIIKPLLLYKEDFRSAENVINHIILLSSSSITDKLDNALTQVLNGNILIFFSSFSEVISCEVKGFDFRSIGNSETETVIKGPREGFVESLQINISSIRRRIKTPDLKIESFSVGKYSKTSVAMLYLEGSTPTELIDYIKGKLKKIDTQNFVFYSNTLEEKLKAKWTPFDTIGYTEKPDIAASKIAECKVIVIFDGTPFSISVPYFFMENFMATDDYTMNIFMGNIGRALRLAAFAMATLLPGFYLALVTHHFRLIPSIFLFKLAILRAGVPVPTVV
ncbi:MAG: spore germination protein, partial [Tissierella sp.]|nr:spore germination protein [Tissierella sp.]